jgi:hypothetical protein
MSELSRTQYCHTCSKAIVITATNATIVEFVRLPGFWHIRAICTYCRARNLLIPMTNIAEAQAAGCRWVRDEGMPSLDLMMWCEEETGLHFVLSNREEGNIAFLAWLLDHSPEELSDDRPEAA